MRISYEQPTVGQKEYLTHLAGLNILETLVRKEVNSIAAVVETDGERIPVGLMVAERESDGSLLLQWLYVSKSYRNNGIASTLLNILRETAVQYNAGQISSTLFQQKMADWDYNDLADFLKRRGYGEAETADGPWIISGKELLTEQFFQKSRQMKDTLKDTVQSFASLSATERRRLLAEFAPDMKVSEAAMDPETSCAFRDKDGWQGILVVDKYGDTYFPRIMKARWKHVEMRLLSGFSLLLGRRMHPTDYLKIEQKPSEIAEWMNKLFPDVKTQTAVRVMAQMID